MVMTNQSYLTVGQFMNPLNFQATIKKQVDLALSKRLDGFQGRINATYLNPEKQAFREKESGARVEPQTVYAAVEGSEGSLPWKITETPRPIMNAKKYQIAREKFAQGSVNADFLLYNHIYPEFQELAKRYYAAQKYAMGSVITSGDYTPIKQAQMLVSLVNLEERTYTIDQSFKTVQSSDIIVDIDTYKRFQLGGFDKGEFESVGPIKGDYTTQRILMRKAMGMLEHTDESMMTPWRHNVMGDALQNLTSDFRRIVAEKVAGEYTGIATETAGGGNLVTFDAGTEHSLINPFLLIGNAASEIDNPPNNGKAAILAMHPDTWRRFLMNSWGRSLFSPVGVGQVTGTIINNVRGLEGFTIYLDKVLPTGKIWILDPQYAFIIQGPVMTENGRNSDRGTNWVIIRNWHRAILVMPSQARFITAT